ncbi:hypothetical protein BT96DRAFT_973742 [Gymnopus androsaceus JB14]|uniref:Uncharacterized protein n=1 Tax=Gymnopus androsaceus JB14 TaxID=1447944 RepID=A0A6A4I1K2_9AGAR|nr:hypothetical protein BT96DRAFT_973742 [Gymnopus androsaceus JB14]
MASSASRRKRNRSSRSQVVGELVALDPTMWSSEKRHACCVKLGQTDGQLLQPQDIQMAVDECVATLPLAAQDRSEDDFAMLDASGSLPTSSLADPSSSPTPVRKKTAAQAFLPSMLVTAQQDLPVALPYMLPTTSLSVSAVSSGCDEDASQDNNHALVLYAYAPSAQPLEILGSVAPGPNFEHLDHATNTSSLPNLDVESSSAAYSASMGTELTITTVAHRDSHTSSPPELAVTTVAITSNAVVPSRFAIPIVATQSSEHSLIPLPIRDRSLVLLLVMIPLWLLAIARRPP